MAKKEVKLEKQTDNMGTTDGRLTSETLTDEQAAQKLADQEARRADQLASQNAEDAATGLGGGAPEGEQEDEDLDDLPSEPTEPEEIQKDDPALATAVPRAEPTRLQKAAEHLGRLGVFFAGKKDDDIVKSHKLNPVDIHLVREMIERRDKNKLTLSDGNIERLATLHKKIFKK